MRSYGSLFVSVLTATAVVALLTTSFGGRPAPGSLLDPWDGLYRNARAAASSSSETIRLGELDGPVTVIRDERAVPHIFASSDRDAIIAFGYVTARDRLFQMDFIPRVAAGRLSEALGPAGLRTDRFMRSIGLDLGARRNADRITKQEGIEWNLADWYCAGVNTVIDATRRDNLPLEFRLLGYEPERCSALQIVRVLQFMSYDLTFRTDDARYGAIREMLGQDDFAELFPVHAPVNEPIIPGSGTAGGAGEPSRAGPATGSVQTVVDALAEMHAEAKASSGFGFEYGKGSNNWAVSGERSTTGSPILAGDMHLRVSLPAVWYEVHIVTPTMNVYGVAVPGAPLPIEAFNDHVAWAFTNTGSDQIDHVALEVDRDGGGYLVDGARKPFVEVSDTIAVRGAETVVDTLRYSDWGPVVQRDGAALALRWVAHDSSRTLRAIWGMLHASSIDEFETATRFWDSPMQNILYADVEGNIAIRSTGYLPLRRGGDGRGLIDGTRAGSVWTGRIPFDQLPYSRNPDQGYLASANQEPVGSGYAYYLGHDWRRSYRGLRINELLREKSAHSVKDLGRYQSDVVAVQARHFSSLLSSRQCTGSEAEKARQLLVSWDAITTIDGDVTLLFDEWMRASRDLVWDEAVFSTLEPYTAQLYQLYEGSLDPKWADHPETPAVEGVDEVICESLASAMGAYNEHAVKAWGKHHQIEFRHLLGSGLSSRMSRGPFEYPGYAETLSPGNGRTVTHSASWRVVVDLSTRPPTGYGVYPGGVSGDPLSSLYDDQISSYLSFEHYRLHNNADPAALRDGEHLAELRLIPAAHEP